MSLLQMRNICKSFSGIPVLKNVQLTVEQGEVHALLGENGAGKSTLMNVLTGVFPRDKGEIEFDGTELKNITIRQSENMGIAFVHQELNLFNDLKVYENIFLQKEYTTKLGRLDKKKMIQEAERLFQELGVDIDPTQQVSKLKTSQKQLLEISKALFFKAKLLILDEATSGLDPVVRDEIIEMFNDFTRDEGHSILISSHIISDLEKLCDYIAFLHEGKLLLCEEKDQLLEEYGLIHCTADELRTLPPDAVKYKRENTYGVQAMVQRNAVPSGIHVSSISMEELFVFMVKEGK